MKLLRLLLWVMGALVSYCAGLYLLFAIADTSTLLDTLTDVDVVVLLRSDSSIALMTLVIFYPLANAVLQRIWRFSQLWGKVLFGLCVIGSIALSLDMVSFENSRLLSLTSAIFSTLVFTVALLSPVSLYAIRDYHARLEFTKSLQKLAFRNPENLVFQSIKKSNFVVIGSLLPIGYTVFLNFYARYTGVSLSSLVDVQTFSAIYLFSLLFIVLGQQSSKHRLLQ